MSSSKSMRFAFGVTLPVRLVGKLDTLRNKTSRDKQLAGRNRGDVIEILLLEALAARKDRK